MRNVWAAYRIEPVLKGIDWLWTAGQQWAILGGNGAGKTAIANLISDQLRPMRGSISRNPDINPERDVLVLSFELQRTLIDHDVRFDDSELRDDAFDVGTTVRQVILRNRPQDERFLEIARRCHVDHILDRGIRFVSTGESRKTLLARALLDPPGLLILDNPYEGLDLTSQQELHTLIGQLLKTSLPVLLLIKQAEEVPEQVSHVLALQDGKVTAVGPRGEVLDAIEAQAADLQLAPLPPAIERRFAVDHSEPLLKLEHVAVSYNDTPILTDINWTFHWGQHCCITGPNGAGKSTLLSLICGDNHKAYGQAIDLFGRRRGSGESIWELKQKFGVVSTQLQLNHIGRTRVAEVVASGLYDSVGLYRECSGQDRKVALQWLQALGLGDISRHYFNQLSFGQQRLAMLARAMVKSPLILILDEPCLGLDDQHRRQILAIVDQVAERGDCHILYVSHTANEMPSCINQHLQLVQHPAGGSTSKVSKR